MYLVIAQLCNYQFFKSNIHIYILINILNQEVASNYPISWRFQWPVRMQMLGGDRCRFGHQPRIYNWNSKLNHLLLHQFLNLLLFTYSILFVHTINPTTPPCIFSYGALNMFLWSLKALITFLDIFCGHIMPLLPKKSIGSTE